MYQETLVLLYNSIRMISAVPAVPEKQASEIHANRKVSRIISSRDAMDTEQNEPGTGP